MLIRVGCEIDFVFPEPTAVILMLVAGLLLGANFFPSHEREYIDFVTLTYDVNTHDPPVKVTGRYRFLGWPLQFWEIGESDVPQSSKLVGSSFSGCFRSSGEAAANLVYDVLACLAIVSFAGLICEAWIVWRARAQKEQIIS